MESPLDRDNLDNLYHGLPERPDLAFCEFERRLRRIYLRDDTDSWEPHRRYLTKILAFCDQFQIDIGIDIIEIIKHSDGRFVSGFRAADQKIDYYCARVQLANASSGGIGTAAYVLEPAQKKKIHHYIQQIRETIEESDLRSEKKEALYSRLNRFSLEVDRDKTQVENLLSAYTWGKREAAELAPLFDRILKIFDVLGAAKEVSDLLPAPIKAGQLPGPQRLIVDQTEHGLKPSESTLDDDIPF